MDQSGKGKHKVHSHFDRSLESGPYTLKYRGSMWGYKRFFRRALLETSDYLKDDCLIINCTVGVVVSAIDCSRLHSIQVPESDIGAHFGMLLENMEGSDITFDVAGEKFHSHKLVLAARSPVFRSEIFDGVDDQKKEMVITDLEPRVFKALLHFIYRDTLSEDVESVESSSASLSSVSETLIAKLLAAADRYCLERLKLMCESRLCKNISVNSVAKILALADEYHATELKAVCLRFAAENLPGEFILHVEQLNMSGYVLFSSHEGYKPLPHGEIFSCYVFFIGQLGHVRTYALVKLWIELSRSLTCVLIAAVMRSDGFEYLKDNCPSLQSELLKTIAGCEEDYSSGGKSRSVWAQLSDGTDTNGRRVRQRT
ncbi:hypothetical protein Golob_001762 [Gossypium lobatum]|uniref:BTB domain-containing protein n=2 Tax=Gossypium TaxID=3633 RepID=A0A7J8NCI3_9ROSI|nr:hypothetical protein [Gossypium lobatum]